MLRPYNGRFYPKLLPQSNATRSSKRAGRLQISSKNKWLSLLPVVALLSVFMPSGHLQSSQQTLRRLAVDCVQSIYAQVDTALNLPTVPMDNNSTVPSYITLCQEWIYRDAYPEKPFHSFRRVENMDVCIDWTAPHYNLMDMLSASIVAAMLPHGRYQHGCASFRIHDEDIVGCDHTTLQQAFPNPIMAVNIDAVSRYALKQQCKAALVSFTPAAEELRIKSRAFHHPFLWPEKPTQRDIHAATQHVLDLVGKGTVNREIIIGREGGGISDLMEKQSDLAMLEEKERFVTADVGSDYLTPPEHFTVFPSAVPTEERQIPLNVAAVRRTNEAKKDRQLDTVDQNVVFSTIVSEDLITDKSGMATVGFDGEEKTLTDYQTSDEAHVDSSEQGKEEHLVDAEPLERQTVSQEDDQSSLSSHHRLSRRLSEAVDVSQPTVGTVDISSAGRVLQVEGTGAVCATLNASETNDRCKPLKEPLTDCFEAAVGWKISLLQTFKDTQQQTTTFSYRVTQRNQPKIASLVVGWTGDCCVTSRSPMDQSEALFPDKHTCTSGIKFGEAWSGVQDVQWYNITYAGIHEAREEASEVAIQLAPDGDFCKRIVPGPDCSKCNNEDTDALMAKPKTQRVKKPRTIGGSSCNPMETIYEEDFEASSSGVPFNAGTSGWEYFKIDQSDNFTNFMGRFARGEFRNFPKRAFRVQGKPAYITLDFDFYEIDNWSDPDCFYINIGDDKVTFGAYFQTEKDEGSRSGISEGGIKWELSSIAPPDHLGFNPLYKDQMHHLTATLNPSDYETGEFTLQIDTVVDGFLENRASGFDNFKVVAYYECPGEPISTPTPIPANFNNYKTETPSLLMTQYPSTDQGSGRISPTLPPVSGPTISAAPIPVPHGFSTCQVLGFENTGDGSLLNDGAYVFDEFVEKYGLTISVDVANRRGGFAPDGKGRIFDTSNPGNITNLGSPNAKCVLSGQGEGDAGEPGVAGENCVPLGNVLIIQDEESDSAISNGEGGTLVIDFNTPTRVVHIGLLNIDTSSDFIEIHRVNGQIFNARVSNLGKNSVQKVPIKADGVVRLVIELHGMSAVTEIATCSKEREETEHPLPPYIVPLKSIIVPLESRLEQASIAWMNATNAPSMEPQDGCIIYIEPTSYGINKQVYTRFITKDFPKCSSISIITTPLCMTASLPTGQLCHKYTSALYQKMLVDFPHIGDTGFENSRGVKLEISCSTAGIASRLMRAKYVLCPPNTPGCLFPAMAKYDDTSAVLMETSDIRKPSDFFAIVGYREHVHVVQVNPQDMPDLVQATNTPKQPKTSKGTPAAEEYIQINVDTDGEGFPIGTTPPPLIPASTTIPLSAKDVLNKLSPNLINPKNPSDMSPTETDPLATNIRNEIIPGPGTIATALDKGLPLNINYLIPKEEIAGGTPHLVSQQLGWDGNVGMRTRPLNEGNYIFQSQLRKASIKRIYDINHEAKSDALQEEKVELNPMLRLELYCPSSPEILKVRDPFYKRMGGLSDKYTKRLLNRLKKGEASMNKVRIPAHEFKFSSPEDMVKLCDKHKETSHDDDPSARRTMSDQRSLEQRRRAAIIHAQAKAKNRPIQIRRVVETENTGRHSR